MPFPHFFLFKISKHISPPSESHLFVLPKPPLAAASFGKKTGISRKSAAFEPTSYACFTLSKLPAERQAGEAEHQETHQEQQLCIQVKPFPGRL